MKKVLPAALGCMTVVLAFTACKKNDWPGHTQKRCDYIQASSTAISDDNSQELPLFKKTFDLSGKLTKFGISYRNIAGAYYSLEEFNVRYDGNKVFFVRIEGDTIASLTFNNSQKLVHVLSNNPIGNTSGQQQNYRINYQGGKIKGIDVQEILDYDPQPWLSYLKFDYDASGKNVKKMTYGDNSFVTYEYNLSKKAKEQYYPDEMLGQGYNLWYFLKALNIFPEVNGEHLLKRSYYNGGPDGYPATFERLYSEHQLDPGGKLVSYKQVNQFDQTEPVTEFWKVQWSCK